MREVSAEFSPAARRAARLAAVQALYQMELSGAPPAETVRDFLSGRLPLGEAGPIDVEADLALFRGIVEAAVEQQERIDTEIARRLSAGWRLERIDAVARAVLRAGVVELWARGDIPAPVTIDEYVEIAKAFFEDGPEPAFINAALDAAARALRHDG